MKTVSEEYRLLEAARQFESQALAQIYDTYSPGLYRYAMQNEMRYGQGGSLTPAPNQQGEPGFHQATEPALAPTGPVETEVPPFDATPEPPAWNASPNTPQNGNGNRQGTPPNPGGNGPGDGNGNH